MTVLNSDGLVGRVVRATRSTATVLLVVDADSVVGGRLGTNLEVGFLRGRGSVDDDGRLALDLVDNSVLPSQGRRRGDLGIQERGPLRRRASRSVGSSRWSPRRSESTRRAVIKPFVDFTALDVVGVVVPKGTQGDRPVLTAGAPR